MDKWSREIAFRIAARAENDEIYQELLRQCEKKETGYQKIMQIHPKNEQEEVDDYIAVCEELEHRMTQLAYALGLADGIKCKR